MKSIVHSRRWLLTVGVSASGGAFRERGFVHLDLVVSSTGTGMQLTSVSID